MRTFKQKHNKWRATQSKEPQTLHISNCFICLLWLIMMDSPSPTELHQMEFLSFFASCIRLDFPVGLI